MERVAEARLTVLAPALMRNPVKHYDWGSTSTLARLQRRPPGTRPEAELWMGAHPSAPSLLVGAGGVSGTLPEAIAADPVGALGRACLDRFGPRLPYLLKVLAVEHPLSIQVHPSAEQAARGFAREQAAGVPADARHRSYVDADAKPEMLYTVTEFEALLGLRPASEVRRLLGLLASPRLAWVLALLARQGDDGLLDAVAGLAGWPDGQRDGLVAEVIAASRTVLAELERGRPVHDPAAADALRWVLRLGEQYPSDPMVVAPLLLQLHRLAPGSTVFTPAGVPHGFLHGTAVEIMSCSDNVVRAGLTSKHVDTAELLALLDPDAGPTIGVRQRRLGEREVAWQPPVAEFQLARCVLDGVSVELAGGVGGPQVLLVMAGELQVRCGGTTLQLGPGESAFVPAQVAEAGIRVTGHGELFRAAPGQPAVVDLQ